MKEKYEKWVREFMESWKDLDYKRTLSIIAEECEYYENPIDNPCSSFDEIVKLWEVVPDNQKDIKYTYEIIACDENVCIINWQMTRVVVETDTKQEIDGIFQISLNDSEKCIFFKQWRFTR